MLIMKFKAKLSKQGNSYCIYVPKDVRTKLELGVDYEWYVRTEGDAEGDAVRTDVIKPVISEKKSLVFNLKKGIYERI